MHDPSLSRRGINTSVKKMLAGFPIIVWAQSTSLNDAVMQMLSTCEQNAILTYNRANSECYNLNIKYNIFNLRDTEVVVCITLVLFKKNLKLLKR